MLILDAITKKLELEVAGAFSTDYTAHYVDITPTTFVPGCSDGNVAAASTVDLVAAPVAATQRQVKSLSIRNRHATSTQTATVKLDVSGTERHVTPAVTLLAGEALIYTDTDGWSVHGANGVRKVGPILGRFLGQTVLTGGVTFTTGPETTQIRVRLVGGGGGGGGCTSVAAAAAAAGGGGAGGYAEKVFTVTPNTAYTYAIGAAGAGASGAAGANGGDTTFAVGATTVTAKGGTGGPQAVAATTLTARAGGAGGVVSTNGDVNGAGQPGGYGSVLIVATPIVASGHGGSSPCGGGGLGLVAVGNGNAAAGRGAGGGGSATGASAVRTGGDGTAGVIIVEEYA